MMFMQFICAIITRTLFILVSLIGVWRVALVKNNSSYWLLTILYVPLVLELVVTLKRRKGQDYKWFSPAILLFLISIIPSIWILELHHRSDVSSGSQCKKLDHLLKHLTNRTKGNVTIQDTVNLLSSVCGNDWILALHQVLLILLIVGKWLLPIGVGVTRDQLSQLLLIFVGTAADILEFTSETLSDVKDNNPQLVYVIMTVWTWSMLQFPLHLSVVGAEAENSSPDGGDSFMQRHQMDLWNIMESILIQDGPFLLVRMVVMSHFKVVHQMLVFFCIKNSLVVLLNLYRLCVIFQQRSTAGL